MHDQSSIRSPPFPSAPLPLVLPLAPSSTYILYRAPWNGLQTPLTLSLTLFTGFVAVRFSFSPLASRSNSALASTCSLAMLRTQTAFSRPLMYVPLMTGCLRGRGETVISTDGFWAAKAGRVCVRKALERERVCVRRLLVFGGRFGRGCVRGGREWE